MGNTPFLLLGLAALLVVLNGLFVAAEFAFVKIRSTRLKVLVREGDHRAQAALFGLENLDAYLSVCQLGITLASLGLGWLGEPAASVILAPLFSLAGLSNSGFVKTLSFVTGFSVITFCHVVFGELAPKTISIRAAERAVLFLAWPMRFFYFLFLPGVKILNTAAGLTLRLLRASNLASCEVHSTDELKILIAESKDGGQLDADEERFVNNIFNLDRRNARDIMVHRTKVKSLETRETVAGALKLIRAGGYTRIPLYEGDKDNVVGFIHAKDLLDQPLERPLRNYCRPALYIFDHLALDNVLEHMRRANQQFGLVWDEYGIWQGLITMEDLIEAIVGQIQDEFDHEVPRIRRQDDGSFIVDSSVSPDELKMYLSLELGPDAEEHYHTLASIFVEQFGEVPTEGDTLSLYGAGFTILKVDGHTISQLLIRPLNLNQGFIK
ncbi:MAG: hemolysin family protein [Candidatus Adiutrix intracellularis]|jgi:CBS domain containing-hemolysin-like protein|nr:hemolysin family protein [Candidatus Adiutrix intracellularis]